LDLEARSPLDWEQNWRSSTFGPMMNRGDLNTATERHIVLGAEQMQGSIRRRAYACITNPDIFAGCRKVSVEALLVG